MPDFARRVLHKARRQKDYRGARGAAPRVDDEGRSVGGQTAHSLTDNAAGAKAIIGEGAGEGKLEGGAGGDGGKVWGCWAGCCCWGRSRVIAASAASPKAGGSITVAVIRKFQERWHSVYR